MVIVLSLLKPRGQCDINKCNLHVLIHCCVVLCNSVNLLLRLINMFSYGCLGSNIDEGCSELR